MQEFVRRNYQRRITAGGVARQMAAIIAAEGRVDQLQKINIPELVIHGDADPLVLLQCGIDTADAIPGAKLKIYPGMGHDLPAQLLDGILDMNMQQVVETDRPSGRL